MSADTLEIVLKYRSLAKSLAGRSVVFKDETMLSFLAYCLSSDDASVPVIKGAVETLFLLAANDRNTAQLTRTFGVFEAVELTSKRDDLPACTKLKALQLYNKLGCKDAPAFCTRSKFKAQAAEVQRPTNLITLYVHGLSKESRHTLESTIVKVKGVISVVLDVDHQRCALRIYESLTPAGIATAIFEGTGMEVRLVSRNRLGQEILKPLLESTSNDTEEDFPPYLAEEESPVKKEAVSNIFCIKDKSSHWLNSAVGFLQKSFYW